MKKILIVFLLSSFFSAKCNEKVLEVIVIFKIDEEKVNITKDCEIWFESKNEQKYKLEYRNDKYVLPRLPEKIHTVDVFFKYEDILLEFNQISVTEIYTNEIIEWYFIVDNKPFLDNDTHDSQIREKHYFLIEYDESGIGIKHTNFIMD